MVKGCAMEYLRESFGVGIEEEFTFNESVHQDRFKFTKDLDLLCLYSDVQIPRWTKVSEPMWCKILKGEYTVKLLPFIPNEGEAYWSYTLSDCGQCFIATRHIWNSTVLDKFRLKSNLVFISEARAEAYLPELMSSLQYL